MWTIGEPGEDMRWVPVPYQVEWEVCDCEGTCVGPTVGYPDLFCSGHSLLPTGEVLIAGGNVTGSGCGGGLTSIFSYDPRNADPDALPYGWAHHDEDTLAIDRWYPTLTPLPDGKVLISGGASRINDGENTFEIYDPVTEMVETLPVTFTWGDMPLYPFIFVLPNGDIMYAGGEDATPAAYDGHILVPAVDAAGWEWADVVVHSTINGGSAVMYEPGKLMKSGGLLQNDEAVDVTEVIDLSCYASNDYPQNLSWTVTPSPMSQRRHFHTMTILPNGNVVATGGNTRSNGVGGEHYANPCEIDGQVVKHMACDNPACPSYSSRCITVNENVTVCENDLEEPCVTDADCGAPCNGGCPDGATCTNGKCVLDDRGWTPYCIEATDTCDPRNNACFATKTAEVWEPTCKTWTELGDQDRPRMYHSTAALLPDGRVMSTGGGHRQALEEQPFTEYFEPEYGNGPRPTIDLIDDDVPNGEDDAVYLPYGGEINLLATNFTALNIDTVNLVKLAAVTHQFDQGQLFVPLDISGGPVLYTVEGPTSTSIHLAEAIAPPGYYMLFALTSGGEVSVGQYVRLGDQVAALWNCPATDVLHAFETVCTGTPVEGVCPSTLETKVDVPLPHIDPSGGPTGWRIAAPAGLVEDASAPTRSERGAIHKRCVAACEAEWSSFPEIAANCGAPGAFGTPTLAREDVAGALDLIPFEGQDGSGIFAGHRLSCTLGDSCCQEFDESLCKATNHRPTLASEPLHGPAEYEFPLADSTLSIETSSGTKRLLLEGGIGYGFCSGSTTEACPFYLDHLDASKVDTGRSTSVTLTCDDGTNDTVAIRQVDVSLAQPAFGIDVANSTDVGFPVGGLIFDISLVADGFPFSSRRPITRVVTGMASAGAFSTQLDFELSVPCNRSKATVAVYLNLSTGAVASSPPSISLEPVAARCGVAMPLVAAATVRDPDDDVVNTRWRMDGVLLSSRTQAITPTGTHTLEVTSTDSRGAATTKAFSFSCR